MSDTKKGLRESVRLNLGGAVPDNCSVHLTRNFEELFNVRGMNKLLAKVAKARGPWLTKLRGMTFQWCTQWLLLG